MDNETEKEVFTINDCAYRLPDEIAYRQYSALIKLLKEAGINISKDVVKSVELDENNKVDVEVNTGDILQRLINNESVPQFFAILLIPVNGGVTKWTADVQKSQVADMMDIGDVTAMRVIKSFLSGRADLIVDIWNYFVNFMKKNEKLMQSIDNKTLKEISKT